MIDGLLNMLHKTENTERVYCMLSNIHDCPYILLLAILLGALCVRSCRYLSVKLCGSCSAMHIIMQGHSFRDWAMVAAAR